LVFASGAPTVEAVAADFGSFSTPFMMSSIFGICADATVASDAP
jgi:hypothetical protein